MNYEKNLEQAKPAAELAYAISYPWGVLQATDAAEDAYGFAPLVPNVARGEAIADTRHGLYAPFRTDIVLLSPDEFKREFPEQSATMSRDVPQVLTGRRFHREGVVVAAAFSQDKNTLHQQIKTSADTLAELIGKDFETETDANGIPLPEVLEHDMPQMLAHSLCDAVGRELARTTPEFLEHEQSKHIVDHLTKLGGIALGCGMGIFALDVATNNVNTFSMTFLASYATLQAVNMRFRVRQVLAKQRTYEPLVAITAGLTARVAASDMHEAYCSKHFDAQIEQQFGDL